MPVVSGFETLPAEHRAWLIREWRRAGYGDNERLARALGERLRADDPAATDPAASTLYRWASKERRREHEIRYLAEQQALCIAHLVQEMEHLPDRGTLAELNAVMSGAQIALAIKDDQSELDEADRRAFLIEANKAATAQQRAIIADQQARLARDKWEAEQALRAKIAHDATTEAQARGVSADGIAALREAIMGEL